MRELIKGVLTDEPTEILEASDGSQAIEIFKEKYASIDLVILDMIMPGIKGDEVLKEMLHTKRHQGHHIKWFYERRATRSSQKV